MAEGDINPAGIIRPATAEEKREMIEISFGSGDSRLQPEKLLKESLNKYRSEYGERHRPYCGTCARLDYTTEINNMMEERGRKFSTAIRKPSDIIKVEKIRFDFDKYGDEDRFEETMSPKKVIEKKLLDGMKIDYVAGYWKNYRCKERGCRHSVFIPIDVWEKELKKDKK